MELDLARKLAESPRLTNELQRRLWATGDRWVRGALVKRVDLDPTVETECVGDDTLIPAWASVPGRPSGLLERATESACSEHSLMALSSQVNLSSAALESLADKGTAMVGWSLLARSDISDALRADLSVRYVMFADLDRNSFGKDLMERIGENPEVWVRILDVVSWRQVGVLHAASGSLCDDESVREAFIATVERLQLSSAGVSTGYDASSPGDGYTALNSPVRTMLSAVRQLLRCSELSADHIGRLSQLPVLSTLRSELEKRAQLRIAETVASLRSQDDVTAVCNPMDADLHVSHLRSLMANALVVSVPATLMVSEALHHRDLLTDVELQQACSLIRGPESRQLAATLERVGRYPDLVEFARRGGVLVLDQVQHRDMVLVSLAGSGCTELLRHRLDDATSRMVVRAYRPLRDVVSAPHLVGYVLDALSVLGERNGETALGLLSGWEGSLDELECAADALTGEAVKLFQDQDQDR